MDKETLRTSAFPEQDTALFSKQVIPVAVPQHEIGIDLDNRVLHNLIETMETSQFDINALNSFTRASRRRNEIYDTLDDIGDDSIIAAVLETYAEDATAESIADLGVGALRKAAVDGNTKEGCFLAGQISGLVNEIKPAKQIIEEMCESAENILKNAGSFIK